MAAYVINKVKLVLGLAKEERVLEDPTTSRTTTRSLPAATSDRANEWKALKKEKHFLAAVLKIGCLVNHKASIMLHDGLRHNFFSYSKNYLPDLESLHTICRPGIRNESSLLIESSQKYER